jgi:hypothetical protein
MIHKGKAIESLCPGVSFSYDEEKGGIIAWYSDKPQPTEEQIQAKLIELQADYDSKQYQRDRLQEYPSIQECVHAILDNNLEALQAKRSVVKAKYPKPE